MHERRDNVLGTDVLGNFRLALECANLNFPTLETFEMALMRSFKLLLTEQTMMSLEDRFQKHLQWVAATHDDHAPHRHVHILALVPGRLQVQDFQLMRKTATEAALQQRKERDLMQEMQKKKEQEAQWELQR